MKRKRSLRQRYIVPIVLMAAAAVAILVLLVFLVLSSNNNPKRPAANATSSENSSGTDISTVHGGVWGDTSGDAASGTSASAASGASGGTSAGTSNGASAGTSGNNSQTTPATPSEPIVIPEDPIQSEDHALTVVPAAAGSIRVHNGVGYEMFYFNKQGTEDYAEMVNNVSAKLPQSTTVYSIVVPNSTGIMLSADVQKKIGSENQQNAIDHAYSRMDSSVKTVPNFDALKNHNGEYIYFHTDHHWTQLGAYYVYRQFCRTKQIMPHDKSEYQTASYPGFVGTFYNYSDHSPEISSNPDTVEVMIPLATNELTYTTAGGAKANGKIVGSSAQYTTFISGDQPFSVIDNPNISDGTSCILIKESYGNAFAPFLTDHYDKVYIVDYRYYEGDLTQFVKDNNVTDVIFLNNTEFLLVSAAKQMANLFK